MNHKLAYQQEQEALGKEAPNLFSIAKTEVFGVPQGYFDLLREESAGLSKESSQKGKDPAGFDVPDSYFEQQAAELMDITASTSPMPASLDTESQLLTPQGYFAELEEAILSRTSRAPQAKVIGLNSKRRTRLLYSISSAAAILIAVAAILLVRSTENDCATFACLLEETDLSHDELLEFYVDSDLEESWVPEPREAVLSDEELTDYLDDDLDWIIETELE